MNCLHEVLGMKTPKEKTDGELIAYATEKARDAGSKNALDMTIGEIEKYALEDASKARMSVKMREIQAKGSQDREAAAHPRQLIAATMALAGVKDETPLQKLGIKDNKRLEPFAKEVSVSRETVGDLRKIVQKHGREEGMSKILQMVEKQTVARKKAVEKALEPKLQEKKTVQEEDGGRKIGEGRPGANSFRRF
jgi:ribosomal protein S11